MSSSVPLRVLVVDDDPTVRDVLEAMLSFEGCEVLTAPDGERSLQMARDSLPDVVVLDVMMPGMDGIEVCRRLKTSPESPRVVMVSGKVSLEDQRRGLDAGADAYLTKPFSPLRLLELVGLEVVG